MNNWLYRISMAWLIAAVVLVLGYWTQWIPFWQAGLYGAAVLSCSLISFLFNGYDKLQARRDKRRIPEKWLHVLELLGGWPGAHFAQQFFRHKTEKAAYRRVYWIIIILHITLLAIALYFSFSASTPQKEQVSCTTWHSHNQV